MSLDLQDIRWAFGNLGIGDGNELDPTDVPMGIKTPVRIRGKDGELVDKALITVWGLTGITYRNMAGMTDTEIQKFLEGKSEERIPKRFMPNHRIEDIFEIPFEPEPEEDEGES
jgi:hypothetical protein